MSLRDRLVALSPAATYSVREIDPAHHRVPHFTSLTAEIVDRSLRIEATEEFLDHSDSTEIHASARFGAVLELVARPPEGVPQRGRQTLWTVESNECEVRADRTGRAAASLTLSAPPLALLLSLVPADPGTEITLMRATWSELLVSDAERALTNRVPGIWTVFEATSREALAAAATR